MDPKAFGVENFVRLLAKLGVINIFSHHIQFPDSIKEIEESKEAQIRALLLRGSVKSTSPPQQQLSARSMACTSHQDRLPSGAAQSAPHHQGRVQLGAIESAP